MQFRATASSQGRAAALMAMISCLCILPLASCAAAGSSAAIQVRGPGVAPQLGFACCNEGIARMQALFNNPDVVANLRDLHAQVAVALDDFSPERAQTVQFLNEQQIPVIAGLSMPPDEGYYFNADNVAEAPARIAAFENWTRDYGLRWAAVGLDIEPDFSKLTALKSHRWRLFTTLLRNSLNGGRIARAVQTCSALVRELQSQGYPVETYEMPYVPAEKLVHSTLLDRMLGTFEIPGSEEVLMVYTSYARPVGSAILLYLGPRAQSIAVGVTDGPLPAGSGFGPLDWNEFSRDLLVASHYSHHIGVYNLEGCVRQGFLPRLKAMDWSGSVFIPAASVSLARRHVIVFCTVLWVASHLLYFIVAALVLAGRLAHRRRIRRRKAATQV
jgi:hypothetical protein